VGVARRTSVCEAERVRSVCGACAERVRSGASKDLEMVCQRMPLLAGDWERRGIGTEETHWGACVW
jgi:hypothetical protein